MKKINDSVFMFDFVIRYIIILLFGLGNLYLFYLFLNPMTLYGMGFLLSFFSGSFSYLTSEFGFIYNGVTFLLVSACVGGSAFYLLFILILFLIYILLL